MWSAHTFGQIQSRQPNAWPCANRNIRYLLLFFFFPSVFFLTFPTDLYSVQSVWFVFTCYHITIPQHKSPQNLLHRPFAFYSKNADAAHSKSSENAACAPSRLAHNVLKGKQNNCPKINKMEHYATRSWDECVQLVYCCLTRFQCNVLLQWPWLI